MIRIPNCRLIVIRVRLVCRAEGLLGPGNALNTGCVKSEQSVQLQTRWLPNELVATIHRPRQKFRNSSVSYLLPFTLAMLLTTWKHFDWGCSYLFFRNNFPWLLRTFLNSKIHINLHEEFCGSRGVLSTEATDRGGLHSPRSAQFFISYESFFIHSKYFLVRTPLSPKGSPWRVKSSGVIENKIIALDRVKSISHS